MSAVIDTFHYDESTDTAVIKSVQDVEPILEANKRAFNDSGGYKSEVMNHKARIPEVIALKWCNDNGVKYQEFLSDPNIMRRFLNDPDNKAWLTRPGRV